MILGGLDEQMTEVLFAHLLHSAKNRLPRIKD